MATEPRTFKLKPDPPLPTEIPGSADEALQVIRRMILDRKYVHRDGADAAKMDGRIQDYRRYEAMIDAYDDMLDRVHAMEKALMRKLGEDLKDSLRAK